MVHSSKTINRNFLIKASGINSEGKRINTLVGVSGLLALIGEDLADKFVTRAKPVTAGNRTASAVRFWRVVGEPLTAHKLLTSKFYKSWY